MVVNAIGTSSVLIYVNRVYYWYGPNINEFTAGEDVNGGNFDLADVPLEKPESGAEVNLPVTFKWTRCGNLEETYRLVIIDQENDIFWTTSDLGDASSYELVELRPDMESNRQYAWYIEVCVEQGSFDESFSIHDISFIPDPTPTPAPSLTTPTMFDIGNKDNSTTYNVDWSPVPLANRYELEENQDNSGW